MPKKINEYSENPKTLPDKLQYNLTGKPGPNSSIPEENRARQEKLITEIEKWISKSNHE